jgi:MerR family transcriptional regulator, light-induced transcriptional regulator
VTPPLAVAQIPTEEDVAALVRHCLAHDERPGLDFIEHLQARGMQLDAIYLQAVAPAARRLGEMWDDDTADFTQVTIGLARLHAMVRRLGSTYSSGACGVTMCAADQAKSTPAKQRVALISPAPGEQHSLGSVIIEDFFTLARHRVANCRRRQACPARAQ